ncbi:MAG: hypothetical protein JNM25_07015 [Planctomycetes bacterium]|nr:hypothetical protein [Planctomycetota bacterium]
MLPIRNAVLPLLLCLAPCAAQTTWIVTQANGVQSAIQGAAPGDVLLLPNTGGFPDYSPFTVDKGVTIRGNGCRIGWGAPGSSANVHELVVAVPAGQRAHLDGLDLTWSYHYAYQSSIGMRLVINGGSVTVQRCSITCHNGQAVTVQGANVVCQACTITAPGMPYAGGPGISAQTSYLELSDCQVVGSDMTNWLIGVHVFRWPAQAAVELMNSTLHAERTALFGGNYTPSPWGLPAAAGACGLNVAGASKTFLADGTITGGNSGPGVVGATALCNASADPVHLANVTLVAGAAGGLPSTGPVDPSAPLARLQVAPPLQRGVTSTFTCLGLPGDPFALVIAYDPAPVTHPYLVEPIWATNHGFVTGGLLDASGRATVAIPVPAQPSLQHQVFWFEAAAGTGLPMHATTLAGGAIL